MAVRINNDADLIIVGTGLAGLVAAAEAADAGRTVILVDQEGEQNLGGQAFWSLGGLFFDSLKPLLHDLFEVNTLWTFDTKQAKAVQTAAGTWQVTFDVDVKKVVGDSAGRETELPMTDWVEIGVFAPAEPGEILGKPLYVQKHRVRSGRQTITVIVPQKPARGGIDPYNLLDWEEGDNIEAVQIGP